MNIYYKRILLTLTMYIVRQSILIQYMLNFNLLLCMTQFISTPTACTHIVN